MASVTIRNLDENLKKKLRVRAALHGISMEEEAREILRCALAEQSPSSTNLADAIRQRFARLGGIELVLPEREALRDPPDVDA